MQRGSHRPRSQRARTVHSHTRALPCGRTHTHTAALTGGHTPTHTCSHARSILTFILQVPPLMLTYMRVLTSGGWLWFWRFQLPQLSLSREPFSRPHITSQSPGCVPGPTPGCLQSLGSWMLLGKAKMASGFGGRTGSHRSEGVQKGLNS